MLGGLGEQFVKDYFEYKECVVNLSKNQYDMEKDMMIDGESVEVKTVVPFITKNALAISESQLHKCMNVDRLIFVVYPPDKDKIWGAQYKDLFDYDCISIYEAPSRDKRSFDPYTTRSGLRKALFPMKNLKCIYKHFDMTMVAEYLKLSVSSVN